jgi:L-cysteate sulfo-lyase
MTPLPTERVELASWPTPLEPAPRLAEAIGMRAGGLWIKRDDLTGLAAGGNKIRKLEWTVAAALSDGVDTLVTTGAPQSNHARLTAAAAARLGLSCVLVFPGDAPEQATGNLVLDGLLGATVAWAGEPAPGQSARQLLDAAAGAVAERLRQEGRRPAVIPFGGSSATGAHGYRLAAQEIAEQIPGFDHLVCAVGSGGMMAGLVAALGPDRVLGVHTGAVEDPRQQVVGLLHDMGLSELEPARLRLRGDQVGDGYETLAPGAAHALTLAARSEGIVLDPVYSARALAGLLAAIEDETIRAGDTVVFLASGGLPGLFGSPEAVMLGRDALQRSDLLDQASADDAVAD